ncbi:hypothetical protein V496_04983 [Pseudogymnoascus sp. VKM F-4515 (FW-2607)]|nr:hypothetical protein V496_04983 [Pseudogymnoascus sp. VKM F-4515 (FW-2607)]KFY86689.1 hypothetical protein V498_07422 [Pseudogymnoascus sp. VKM F-4517 (FW-2822)]
MSEAGPSSAGRRTSTGEFTDDENLDIPLRDIREAEFERLEEGPVTKEVIEEEKTQRSRWPLWPLNKRRRSSAGYTQVDDDDAASPLAANGLKPKQTKKASGGVCGGKLVWGIFIFLIVSNLLFLVAISFTRQIPNPLSRWGAPGTTSEGLSWYPTDFLRDVQPISCHSHNDYWRTVPLFSALHAGCISVEADVWLFPSVDSLFIGHNTASLTDNRTFTSLYVDPLVKILEDNNPQTEFNSGSMNGVFDTDSEQSLTLLIDVKTKGAETWAEVLRELQPLRDRGWLTFMENSTVHQRPITVVGTGNTPFDVLTSNSTYRDAFFDAPLQNMYEDANGVPSNAVSVAIPGGQGAAGTSATDTYTTLNSFYASTSFEVVLGKVWLFSISDEQKETIRGQIRGAKRRGLKARYWDQPTWPTHVRNEIWTFLWEEGVAVLNVDDIEGVKKMW